MADYTDSVHDFLLALVDENDPVTDDAQVIAAEIIGQAILVAADRIVEARCRRK